MIETMISISKNENDVFIQTNLILNRQDCLSLETKEEIKPLSNADYLTINEEDCIELAQALSYCVSYTEYEDENYFVTRFSDGKIIKQYRNE